MTSRQLLLFSDHSDSASYDVTSLAVPVEQSVTTQAKDPAASEQSLPKRRAKPRPAEKTIRKKANKPRKQQQTVTAMPVVLRVGEVALRYSASIPTIWRWVKEKNGFPAPVQLTLRRYPIQGRRLRVGLSCQVVSCKDTNENNDLKMVSARASPSFGRDGCERVLASGSEAMPHAQK